ncbi:MAG: fibronectin type III domain-containing protein [Acidimicrobiia bacterium]
MPGLGAATITSVTAGVGSLTVSFTKPTHDGGRPILHYRITCISSDGGVANIRTGITSPVVVPGLSPAKSYTCDVIAHNRLGDGPASLPSVLVVTLAQST